MLGKYLTEANISSIIIRVEQWTVIPGRWEPGLGKYQMNISVNTTHLSFQSLVDIWKYSELCTYERANIRCKMIAPSNK